MIAPLVALRSQLSLRGQLGRLSGVHTLHSGAETLFAISLAGSLFFSVSLDAARPRILLYLVLTLAPFAVLAPLIGPVIDRIRGGHRVVLVATLVGRASLAAALSGRELTLWLYPLAFGVLVLGKTYSVARNAFVPTIASGPHELVRANSQLAVVGTVGGGLAAAVGAGLLETVGSSVVLWVATATYLAAAVVAVTLHRPPEVDLDEIEEFVELASPAIRSASTAMSALRAAVGFVTFHLGFALKRAGEPVWIFGLVLVANGAGGIVGTLLSPALRRRMSEYRMLTLALTIPAAAAVVAALRFHWVTVAIVSFAIGLGVAVGRRAFDNVVQERAPHASRGAAYAGLETRLELSWVAGALAAVLARVAGWLGLVGLAAALAGAALARTSRTLWQSRFDSVLGREPIGRQLLVTARELDAQGESRQAVVVAAAAVDAACDESRRCERATEAADAVGTVRRWRDVAVAGSEVDAVAVFAAAEAALERIYGKDEPQGLEDDVRR